MVVLDDFTFFVKDDELAITIDCPVAEIASLVWDEKNTLILKMEDGSEYMLVNILPNIREILHKINSLMVIFKKSEEVKEAFDVELIKNPNLNFDDNFQNEALSCYTSIKNQ